MLRNDIAEQIKFHRKNKNITQKELADAIGKSLSSVQKYELSKIDIPSETLEKIADVLGVKTIQLYGYSEKATRDSNAFIRERKEKTFNAKIDSFLHFLKFCGGGNTRIILQDTQEEGVMLNVDPRHSYFCTHEEMDKIMNSVGDYVKLLAGTIGKQL